MRCGCAIVDDAAAVNQLLTRISALLFTMPLVFTLALMLLLWPNDPLRRTATIRELAFVGVMVNTIVAMFFGIAGQNTPVRWIMFLFATAAAWAFAGVAWWEWGRRAWRQSSPRLRHAYITGAIATLAAVVALLIWLF